MVQLWIPKDELKADLQDQARKRLEEIEREAEKRRNQIMQASQDKLNDQRVQAAMARFNEMVDPLLQKGGEALEGAASGIQDTSERARQMVEEAQKSLQQAPTLDQLGQPQQPQPEPEPPQPQQPTPPQHDPMLGAQTPPSPTPGISGQSSTPPAAFPQTPDISLPPPPDQSAMVPPGLPGGAPPPPDPPGFKPPGSGLGSALADRIRGGMDAAGQGIGDTVGGLGDQVTQGRDQAMELANKSLDIARDAMNRGGDSFAQTPVARAVTDANSFRPPGLGAIRDAALPLFTGPSAASQTAEAIAPWTPENQRNQEAWESYQGTEREGAGLGGLLTGAAAAARKQEQQTREQGETMLGKGTQGEGPLQALQAGFGYAMAPYGALPEIARGGVEEATGSPLAGAAAYGAASILGPGGIRSFLREQGPTALRMVTNPRVIPELLRNDPTGTAKAIALALGGIGGTGMGVAGGVGAIQEGKSPQEAAAEAVTTAADWLQISEAAGLPIEGVAKIWGALPKLGIRPPSLPKPPGIPGAPELPGMPERPRLPGEPSPEVRPSTPEERAPEEGLTPDEGLDGAAGRLPGESAAAVQARMRARLQAERNVPSPGIEEAPSAAQRFQAESEATGRAADEVQRRQGPLGFLQRFGENLAGAQGQGPEQGVLFGNAPRTMEVGGRQVGAMPQTLNGAETLLPETDIDITGRRTANQGVGQSVDPATRQIRGSIEDRLARAYRERDLTADEEDALGLGMPGQSGKETQKVEGLNRTLGFRHPGWRARDYAPDLEAGVMRYKTPDEGSTPEDWYAYTRYGKKGDPRARYVPRKKGTLDLDEGDEPTLAATKEETKGSKAKVLLRGRVGPDHLDNAAREVDIMRDGEMPWKQEQTPITVKEGMARDGSVEPVAQTPLSFHRLALVRGLGLRNFYPNFGQIFRDDLARKSPTMLRELNAIYGATASQASPETNLQRTLAAMAAGRYFKNKYGPDAIPTLNELSILTASKWDANRHKPTERVGRNDEGMFPAGGITGADLNKVIRIWETGRADIGAGWKTPVFFQNILTSAKNKFDWLSVPDTHMFRGRGYTMTGGSAPATVNQDLRALGITHATVAQLADEFGLNPKQVQSALWFDYKENLSPFNATDKARVKARAGTADETSPAYIEEARKHDPWPISELRNKPRLDAEGNPLLKEDGTPQYETARQGTIDSVMQHVSGVRPGWAQRKLADDAAVGRGEVALSARRGKNKVEHDRFDLLKAFRDQDAEFKTKYGRDALTPQADEAALTFNGRAVGDQATTGWQTEPIGATPLPAEAGAEGMPKGRYPAPEITPEAMERAAFRGGQDAPVAVVPVDSGDGEALSRMGYDSATKQIDTLRAESIPHEVILTNRPFTVGAPGAATPRDTIHVLFPGASLETARYGASLLGERAGVDEVAITWPTAPGKGRPVVSVDHPEGKEWTDAEIAKYPWAQKLIGRANVSPDGRTLYFADLGTDNGGVSFGERVQGILDDAMSPEEQQALVHRDESFGIARVGADEFREVVGRGTLAAGGPLGEQAMARAFPKLAGGTPTGRPFSDWGTGGEDVPGSRPGAVSGTALRETPGPERFRPEGAPVGSLGIRDGQPPIRDSLDEKLQMGQMVAGAAYGAYRGDQSDEEDTGLQRAGRIVGGGIGGALLGANAPNARRIYRAALAARAFPPSADINPGVRRNVAFDPEAMRRANRTARAAGSVSKNAVTPRYLVETATPEEAGAVLDFGSGDEAPHTQKLRELGYDVTAHEFGDNVKEGVHDPTALDREYDTVYASNVLNVQETPEMLNDTLGQIASAVKQDGRVVFNYPVSPRKWENPDGTKASPAQVLEQIRNHFGSVERVGGSKGDRPIWEARDPIVSEDGADVAAPAAAEAQPGLLQRAAAAVGRFGTALAGDEAGVLGARSKGPPTGDVPKSGELRGEQLGLGDLEDPENLTELLVNPPKGMTGEQINEIGRAAFKRLRSGMTSEQTVQQREVERSRRMVRRQEGIQKVEQATTPEQVQDAVVDAQDAAQRGEIPYADADAVRGKAAKKLQEQRGEDGPPPPGEIDRQVQKARARREAKKATTSATAVGPRAEGISPEELARRQAEAPEGVAVARGEETPRQLAMGEDLAPGEPPVKPIAGMAPPSDRDLFGDAARPLSPEELARREAAAPAGTAALRGEAEARQLAMGGEAAPGRPPEPPIPGMEAPPLAVGERARAMSPEQLTRSLTPLSPTGVGDTAVARGEQAPRQLGMGGDLAPPATPLPRIEGMEPPPVEAARQRESGETQPSLPDLIGPAAHRFVDEHGNLLSRQQIASAVMGQASQPGGWNGVLREVTDGWSDAMKGLAAAGRGVPLAPKEIEGALARMGGRKGKGTQAGPPSWEGLSAKQRESFKDFRWSHVLDALGTYQRMNMVVTPEGFGRNFMSTTAALPLRFYEAATAPLFDRMWGAIPGQADRGPDPAHSREAVAMAEGLYRSWAAGLANAANVMRKGDAKLTEAQMGDPSVDSDFRSTRLGAAMGAVFRPMTATDTFLKTLNEGMEAYRLAFRQAQNEFDKGLLGSGEGSRSVRSRMIEIMNTPNRKMLSQVQQAGEYNTYNQKAGRIASLMEGFKNLPEGTPEPVAAAWKLMMNTVVPFVRISTNVMKFGLERTIPGGLISTAMGKGRADRADRFAKMSEGALMLGGLWGAQQAGLVEVSGKLPDDPDERDEWEMQGKTPFSVRIGDRWYNPQAFPGLAENVAMLGMMGDTKSKLDAKEAAGQDVGVGDYLGEIPGGITQYLGQVGVRPAFGSLVDSLNVMTASNDRDRDFYANRLKRSMVGQLLPASGAMRQIGNVTDQYQRDAQSVPEMAAAAYPFFRESLPEKLNARGAPMTSEGYEFPLAGLTSSRAARDDALLPREYLGSESAAMDAQIGSAIRAVQLYESDPRAHPRPSTAQRNLYYRFKSRKNPARQRMNKAADRLDFQRKNAHLDLAEDGLFNFRAPGRLQELVGD